MKILFIILLLCSPIIAQETNVRLSDGKDVTQGNTTDTAVTGDTAGTSAAKLRGLNKIITLVWDNVNNRINVNIQNIPAVSQSGTWNINNISGTISLPTGASTSALQTTGNSSLSSIDTKTLVAGQALMAASSPVVIASNQSAVPISGTITTTPPANATTNIVQLNGTTIDTNSGVKSAGTMRVVLATDQPQLTNKLLVTPDSIALPANQSVNVSQINGITPLMGNGVTGTGSQRVTIASDNTAFPVTANAGTNLNTSGLLTDTQLRATPVPISGTITANAGTNLNTSALALSATQTDKTQFTKVTDGTDTALISGTGSLQVTCDNCGAPATFSDNSVFTFGTTGITNIGAVVDDVATNSVTENSSGLPRMTPKRQLLSVISDPTTTTQQLGVNASGQITAVTVPPANASTNLAQVVGTAIDVNSGVKSAGTLRVVLATDQPQLTNKLLVTPDSVALPANQSVNVNQIVGTTADVNSGVKSAGTLRVVLATDQPALTNKLLVTPDSVALPANQSVNINQINSVTPLMGNGITGTGSPRVTIASDNTTNTNPFLAKISQTTTDNDVDITSIIPGTGTTNQAKVSDTAPSAGWVGIPNLALRKDTNAQTTGADGRWSFVAVDAYGATFVSLAHPNKFSCFVQAVTVTTQCQAAPAAGLKNYITGFMFDNQVATVQTLDIVFGTGANCVTGITALTHKFQMGTNGTTTSPFNVISNLSTPLNPTAANAICVRPSAATAFGVTITGFVAP